MSAFIGLSEAEILNSDASKAGYKGNLFGADIDARIWGQGEGELRLFARYGTSNMKNVEVSTDELIRQHNVLGLKGFIGEMTFISAGYGYHIEKFKSESSEFSLNNSGLSVGIGMEIPVTESVSVVWQGVFHSHVLKKETPLSSNSHVNAGDFFVGLSWSPPMTIINMTTTGR
jgi:hypothetical protein